MHNIKRGLPAILALFALFLYAQMFVRLPGLSGDASIYWTFARSMWEQGPFYFGTVGPKHGATSPLWAFLLSLLYLVKPHFYQGFQGLSIVLMGGTAISTGLLVRHLTKSTTFGVLAPCFLLMSIPLHRYTSAGYDTGLITWTFVEAVRAAVLLHENQTRGRWIHWAIPMAALPLARPEGVLFFPVIALWVGYFVGIKQGKMKDFLIVGFIAGLPSLFFYLWMYAQTGHIVPTSVQGRDLVHSANDTYWPPVAFHALVYRNFGGLLAPDGLHQAGFAFAWMGLVGLGVLQLLKTHRIPAVLFGLLPSTLFLMMLWRNPSFYMVRYSLPVLTMGVTFGTLGVYFLSQRIAALPQAKRMPVGGAAVIIGLVLCAAPVSVIYTRAHTPREATIPDVLDLAGTKIANELVGDNCTAVVYEIQTQYWLKCKIIAGSGIVGGEIFPYLATKDIQKLKDIGVTHVFLSNAYDYRSIFDDTVMEHLWNVNDSVPVNGTVDYKGLTLKKLTARDFQIMKPHWIAIYEIVGGN